MNSPALHAQLTLATSSSQEFGALALSWLDRASREVVPERRLKASAQTDWDDSVLAVPGPQPVLSPPHGVFAAFHVAKRGGFSGSAVATDDRWSWLSERLQDADSAMYELSALSPSGQRTSDQAWFSIDRAPGRAADRYLLLGMSFDEVEAVRDPAMFERRMAFLRRFASDHQVAFGHISYARQQGETDFEVGLNLWHGRTIPRLAENARGYSWVTILNESLLARLGGARHLAQSEAFCEVAELADGSVWLQATESWASYRDDSAAVAKVFQALAPILPAGTPIRLDSETPPLLLAQRDASTP